MLVERENINNVICKCLKVWSAMTLVIGRMSYCVYILLDPDLDPIHLKVSKPCLGRFLLMWIDLQAVCGTQCLRQWWCCSGLQLFLNHCVLCALQCSFQSNLERNPQRSDVVKEEEREPGQKQGLMAGVFIIDLCRCWGLIWLGRRSELTHSGIWNRIITWVWCRTFPCPCHTGSNILYKLKFLSQLCTLAI